MLQIAKVLKSNGTDGGILLGLHDIAIEEIDLTEPVFIEFDGLPVPFFIEEIQPKGSSRAIAHITGVKNLKDAEETVGRAVYTDYLEYEEDDAPDFTGWDVFDEASGLRFIGKVDGIEDIPGNPCLIIGENLVPLHSDLVSEMDEENRKLILKLPEGLIQLP